MQPFWIERHRTRGVGRAAPCGVVTPYRASGFQKGPPSDSKGPVTMERGDLSGFEALGVQGVAAAPQSQRIGREHCQGDGAVQSLRIFRSWRRDQHVQNGGSIVCGSRRGCHSSSTGPNRVFSCPVLITLELTRRPHDRRFDIARWTQIREGLPMIRHLRRQGCQCCKKQ